MATGIERVPVGSCWQNRLLKRNHTRRRSLSTYTLTLRNVSISISIPTFSGGPFGLLRLEISSHDDRTGVPVYDSEAICDPCACLPISQHEAALHLEDRQETQHFQICFVRSAIHPTGLFSALSWFLKSPFIKFHWAAYPIHITRSNILHIYKAHSTGFILPYPITSLHKTARSRLSLCSAHPR